MSDSEEEEVHSRTVKITIVGEPHTGKSSLCARYVCGGAGSAGGTQGAEVLAAQCAELRPPVPLQLCDVAGNTLGTHMLDNYLYASDIVLFVYDITNLQSFDKLHTWLGKVKEIFEPELKKPLMALFGNKSDLEHQRAVRLSVVQKLASEHLLENFKGSARTGEMVTQIFTRMVARVMGAKVRRPAASTNGKANTPDTNGQIPITLQHPTHSLIMNRKALRKVKEARRRALSSVCSVQ